jgi:hypothetical protein
MYLISLVMPSMMFIGVFIGILILLWFLGEGFKVREANDGK